VLEVVKLSGQLWGGAIGDCGCSGVGGIALGSSDRQQLRNGKDRSGGTHLDLRPWITGDVRRKM